MNSWGMPRTTHEASKLMELFGQHHRMYGMYRGRVENVKDPQLRGRIQVRILLQHPTPENDWWDGIPSEDLPWAEPCMSDGGGRWVGDFNIPYHVGDFVWIMFEGGDPDYPVWMGFPIASDTENIQSEYKNKINPNPLIINETPPECIKTSDSVPTEYPWRRVLKTRRGITIEMSDTPGNEEVRITTIKGNYIQMDDAHNRLVIMFKGDVYEHYTGNVSRHVGGNVAEFIKGDYYQYVGGNSEVDTCMDSGDTDRRFSNQDKDEYVAGNRTSHITGDENRLATGNMYDVGAHIYHNSGNSQDIDGPTAQPYPDSQHSSPVALDGNWYKDKNKQEPYAFSANMLHIQLNTYMQPPAFPNIVPRLPWGVAGPPQDESVVHRNS